MDLNKCKIVDHNRRHFFFWELVDVVFNWDVGKNDSFECGGEKWTSVMSQKMDHLQKEAKKFCD